MYFTSLSYDMLSRPRWRVMLTVGAVGPVVVWCRWSGIIPEFALVWVAVLLSMIVMLRSLDRRYHRPYRGYALAIVLGLQGLAYRGGYHATVSMPVVMIYTNLLTAMLVTWMAHPSRYWIFLLVPRIVIGFSALIPRDPSPLTPQSITQSMPTLQLYRERQTDDEQILLFTDDKSQPLRPGVAMERRETAVTIQYASQYPSDNYLLLQLNTLTTIALAPQSAIDLVYDGITRSGALIGGMARYTTEHIIHPPTISASPAAYTLSGIGQISMVSIPDLTTSHSDLVGQAQTIADEVRPSPWTRTTLGANMLRTRLQALAMIDPSYQEDLQTLHQYQCLVYTMWCDQLPPLRYEHSLHIQSRDADLQQTVASGTHAGWTTRDNLRSLLR